MQEAIEREVARLKRGLMGGDEKTALLSIRNLYETGSSALPVLERELSKIVLTQIRHPEALQLFSGLAGLQRDIDEQVSNNFLDQTLSKPCTAAAVAIIRSLRRQSLTHFRKSRTCAIEIFESTEVDTAYGASEKVAAWLQDLPSGDLEGISRIYILARRQNSECLGSYMPILSVLTLTWLQEVPANSRLIRWIDHYHRDVLYHEIGHHVHRHWFGQDPQQEREADRYSTRHSLPKLPIWFRFIAQASRVFRRAFR